MPVLNPGILDGARRITAAVRELAVGGGVPGAPLGLRIRGAGRAGPPGTGTWRVGDVTTDRAGGVWTCTAGGTPGTWVSTAGAGWYSVRSYGAAGNGIADDTAAIQAAVSACTAGGGGVVWFPAGRYKVTSTITASQAGTAVYLRGAGRWASVILSYVTGDCLRVYDSSTYSARTVSGGGIAGLLIDGTNSGNGSAGVHMGDIFQYTVDFAVQGFAGAGSIGAHFDNNYYWTEQLQGRVYAQSCATHVMLDNSANTSGVATGSFDRISLDCFITSNGTGDGVTLANGAQVVDGANLGIFGNFSTSAAQYAVLRVTGSNGGGSSQITHSTLNIGAELDDTVRTAPYTIYFGASGNVIGRCTGLLDFGAGDAFTGSNNAGQFTTFTGQVAGDPNLPSFLPQGSSNIADSPQAVSATSGSPAAVTGLSAPVAAFTACRIRGCVPYSSAVGAGTPTFLFSGPSWALASVNWWFQTSSSPFSAGPAITTSKPVMTGPVLSAASNLALWFDGVIVPGAGGTLGLQAYTSNASDTFTIAPGAYIEILPVSDP